MSEKNNNNNNNFTSLPLRVCACHTLCTSKAVGQRKEFPHQSRSKGSQSKGPLSHYRFMASSTYKCISTKRLLLLIHVTNFARYRTLCLQICPVSGAPLVCVRSTFGPSPELLWEVEITGPDKDQDKNLWSTVKFSREFFSLLCMYFCSSYVLVPR